MLSSAHFYIKIKKYLTQITVKRTFSFETASEKDLGYKLTYYMYIALCTRNTHLG